MPTLSFLGLSNRDYPISNAWFIPSIRAKKINSWNDSDLRSTNTVVGKLRIEVFQRDPNYRWDQVAIVLLSLSLILQCFFLVSAGLVYLQHWLASLVENLSRGNLHFGSSTRYLSLGFVRLGTVLGIFDWDISLGSVVCPRFVWKWSLRLRICLESVNWCLSLGDFRLGYSVWEFRVETYLGYFWLDFRLRTLAWELSVGDLSMGTLTQDLRLRAPKEIRTMEQAV